ncbi:hypothetical protein [Ectobacillus sp. sgz5001026]|uniref:hypothetical protein n=1 Tax=Ectobacillus sp. sgz5001026 TaxID=3242473 RepID=UPI0036D26E91
MKTKIGFVGNCILQPVLDEVSTEFTDVELNYYFYKSEREALELTLAAQKEVDVVLFGGPVPYYVAESDPKVKAPLLYISYDGAAFYRGLLHVLVQLELPIEKLSVDMILPQTVNRVYEDLGLSSSSAYVYPTLDGTGKQYFTFHKSLYEGGKTRCAITCVLSTFELLRSEGIPAVLVLATESAIREGIQRAVLLDSSNYFKKSQIAVGHIHFLDDPDKSEYEGQRIHLERHRQLVTYAKELHADIFAMNRTQFVFYSTRGMLEKRDFAFIEKLLRDLKSISQNSVHIGLGFGNTAQIAGERAKMALVYCKRFEDDQCFLTLDEEQIVNLFDNKEQSYRTDDVEIQHLAEQHHVSAMVIKRVSHVLEKLGKTTITAEELANELGQTIRNSRRTLKYFVEKGLAIPIGEEHLGGKGRPKILYQLLLTVKS